ncbi:hypothetical protein FBQ98_01470 [Gammaproteobacteria bacterium PRO6]|nr:hypothetical protein [Gammaproteobacteria bacterium PRO6]
MADPDHPAPPAAAAPREILLHAPGSLRLASDALPWQRSLRWDKPVRERRVVWLGLVLAIAATVIELGGFMLGMHSYRTAHWRRATAPQVITVQLIEPISELPPAPPEPEPPIVVRPSRIAIAPPQVRAATPPPTRAEPDSDAMRARMGSAGAAPLKLFNADGSVQLGAGATPLQAPAAPAPRSEREAAQQRWAKIEERGNPLSCRKTRFAAAFRPDESVGTAVARKYLGWIGLADPQAIAHERQKRAESGGCEPAP